MTVLFVLVALAVVLAIGLLAVGRLGELPAVERDRTPDRLPAEGRLSGIDVDAVRFDVGLRGYRMDEVDEVLDRVAADLAARDAVIADLRGRLDAGEGPRTGGVPVEARGRADGDLAPSGETDPVPAGEAPAAHPGEGSPRVVGEAPQSTGGPGSTGAPGPPAAD